MIERLQEVKPSTRMWAAIIGGVALYDIFAPPGDTLSEAVDRALEHSPYRRAATLGAIAITAAHLCNLIPERLDPFHHALKWKDNEEIVLH